MITPRLSPRPNSAEAGPSVSPEGATQSNASTSNKSAQANESTAAHSLAALQSLADQLADSNSTGISQAKSNESEPNESNEPKARLHKVARPTESDGSNETPSEDQSQSVPSQRPTRLQLPAEWTQGVDWLDEASKATLESLLHQHGAKVVLYWQPAAQSADPEGEIEPVNPQHDMPEELVNACRGLAMDSLRTHQTSTKLYSGAVCLLGVSSPLPHNPGFVATVLFPWNRSVDHANDSQSRAQLQARTQGVKAHSIHLGAARSAWLLEATQGALLESRAENNKKPLQQIADGLQAIFWSMIGSRKKIIWALLGILAVGFIPFPHKIKCKVACEPQTRRFISSPFNAKLLDCTAKPGDAVQEGELLATLDGSDFRSEIAGLRAQLAQSGQRRTSAIATGDASTAELERLETQQVEEKLKIFQQRLQRLEIRSPVTGQIVAGNLERSKGSTLKTGQNLFEVAPVANMLAEIAIPEEQLSYVKAGMNVRLTLDSHAGASLHTELQSIHPRNEVKDSVSVYIAEAPLDNSAQELRPGMTGYARIHAGYQPIGWLLFHRPCEKVRQAIGW